MSCRGFVHVAVFTHRELDTYPRSGALSIVKLTLASHSRCLLLYDQLTWGIYRSVARGARFNILDISHLDLRSPLSLFLRPVGLRLSLHQQCYGRGYMRRLWCFSATHFLQFRLLVDAFLYNVYILRQAVATLVAWPLFLFLVITALWLVWLFNLTCCLLRLTVDSVVSLRTSGLCAPRHTETYGVLLPSVQTLLDFCIIGDHVRAAVRIP